MATFKKSKDPVSSICMPGKKIWSVQTPLELQPCQVEIPAPKLLQLGSRKLLPVLVSRAVCSAVPGPRTCFARRLSEISKKDLLQTPYQLLLSSALLHQD